MFYKPDDMDIFSLSLWEQNFRTLANLSNEGYRYKNTSTNKVAGFYRSVGSLCLAVSTQNVSVPSLILRGGASGAYKCRQYSYGFFPPETTFSYSPIISASFQLGIVGQIISTSTTKYYNADIARSGVSLNRLSIDPLGYSASSAQVTLKISFVSIFRGSF